MSAADQEALRKENPSTWIPVNPGDTIEGDVSEVVAAWSDTQYDGKDANSGYYPLLRVSVREANGYKKGDVLAVHAFSTVLKDRIVTKQPLPGEHIVIRYDGEGVSKVKGRNAPHLYTVEMPDRDPAQDAARAYAMFPVGRGGGAPTPVAGDVPPAEQPAEELPY